MLVIIVMYLYIAHLHGVGDGKQDTIDVLREELKTLYRRNKS